MIYRIMLVDDELPALRYLKAIITKHAPAFCVTGECRDGSDALLWLREHRADVDLLITDIKMPDMDGITLAKAARELIPQLHIIIVSGYQEFEYAHGAIEASVDDYILKPVSVSHMTDLLSKIKADLDSTLTSRLSMDLTALLNFKDTDSSCIRRFFDKKLYRFALFRLGNVTYPQIPLLSTSIVDPFASETASAELTLLSGRDEKEFIAAAPSSLSEADFRAEISSYIERSASATSLAVWSSSLQPFESVKNFYEQASRLIRHCMVIGHRSEYVLPQKISDQNKLYESLSGSARINASMLKRIELNIIDNDTRSIHEIFISLSEKWDEEKTTQRQVYIMMQQLIHHICSISTGRKKSTDQIIMDADLLTNNALNYKDLMENLYTVIFSGSIDNIRQLSAKDMYDYAVRSVQEKYYRPINIQTVCAEIGISQTYLSRLFRKYGNTSFNSFLTECRMENAKKMIKNNPEMPLHQIAACTGYEDYAYFSKVFRQNTGMTPSQYQKQ